MGVLTGVVVVEWASPMLSSLAFKKSSPNIGVGAADDVLAH